MILALWPAIPLILRTHKSQYEMIGIRQCDLISDSNILLLVEISYYLYGLYVKFERVVRQMNSNVLREAIRHTIVY